MIESALALVRGNSDQTMLRKSLEGPKNLVFSSGLELILKAEKDPSLMPFRHLILEATTCDGLPWDEGTVMDALNVTRLGLQTTIFVGPTAHSWNRKLNQPGRGPEDFIRRMTKNHHKPRIFVMEAHMNAAQLASGWQALTQKGETIYRTSLPSSVASAPKMETRAGFWTDLFEGLSAFSTDSFLKRP